MSNIEKKQQNKTVRLRRMLSSVVGAVNNFHSLLVCVCVCAVCIIFIIIIYVYLCGLVARYCVLVATLVLWRFCCVVGTRFE